MKDGSNKGDLHFLNFPSQEIFGEGVFWVDTDSVDLDVVQLLLPLHDVLHAVHPDIDVAHQDRLAHVLN